MDCFAPSFCFDLGWSLHTPCGPGVFFQRCEIRATSVLIDYKPRRVDVAALRAGNLIEVVNMTGWSDVALALPGVTLKGVHGWDNLAAAVAQRYFAYVATGQQVRLQLS